jgi:outer membrane protein
MKKWTAALLLLIACAVAPSLAADKVAPPTVGTVNFKTILEKSKVGKEEQSHFDQIRKQIEQSIEQKEKELNELAPKFSDEYLDSLTPEAESELKEKFKTLSQDLTQQQNQYYQTLNQANMQVVQKIFDMIAEASKAVAKEKGLDLILNEESCFYKADKLDLSAEIIKKLDEMHAAAEKAEKKQ